MGQYYSLVPAPYDGMLAISAAAETGLALLIRLVPARVPAWCGSCLVDGLGGLALLIRLSPQTPNPKP